MERVMNKTKRKRNAVTITSRSIPAYLSSKTLVIYVRDYNERLHIGIYGDNSVRFVPFEEDAYQGKRGVHTFVRTAAAKFEEKEDPIFEGTAGKCLDLIKSLPDNLVPISKTEVQDCIIADDSIFSLMPKKLRWKQGGTYWEGPEYEYWKWENQPISFIFPYDHINILNLVTVQPELLACTEVVRVTPDNHDDWTDALMYILKDCDIFAADTETFDPDIPNGPKGLIPWEGKLRSLQIYNHVLDEVMIFDFGARFSTSYYPKEFGALLERELKGRTLIWHNALFDKGFLYYAFNIDLWHTNHICTRLLSQHVWAGVKFVRHSLGDVAERCGIEMDKGLQTSDFGTDLTNSQWNYGALDTIVLYEVYCALRGHLTDSDLPTNLEPAKLDCEFLHVCHMIRTRGMFVDSDALEEARALTESLFIEAENAWRDAAGFGATVSSQKLVPWLEGRGHDVLVADAKTRQKKRSANKEVLARAAETDPVCQLLLDARAIRKTLESIENYIGSTRDGRVYGGITPLANQGLGRTSAGKLVRQKGIFTLINNQNIPTKNYQYPQLPNLRKPFTAPPGYKYVGIDLCLDMEKTRVPVKGKGIIPLAEVCIGDYVYGYDPATEGVVWTEVNDTVHQVYTGDMYRWKGNYMHQTMTEGHRIFLRDGRVTTPEEVASQEAWQRGDDTTGRRSVTTRDIVTCAAPLEGGLNPHGLTPDDVRLMVAMAADGHYPPQAPNSVAFNYSKERKNERHQTVLSKGPWRTTLHEANQQRYKYAASYNGERVRKLKDLMPDKALPQLLLALPLELRQVAFEEIGYWDGCRSCRGSHVSYSTIRESEAHVVVTLALSLGYTARYKASKVRGNRKPCYKVCVVRKDGVKGAGVKYSSPLWGKGKNRRYERYPVENLEVGCLRTTTTNFFILTDTGRMELTGNCSAHAREAASFSGCKAILDTMQPGEDTHSFNASIIVKNTVKTKTPLADYDEFKFIKQGGTKVITPDYLFAHGLLDPGQPASDDVVATGVKYVVDMAKHYRDIAKTAFYLAINIGGAGRLQASLAAVGIIVTIDDSKAILAALWEGIGEIKDFVLLKQAEANSYDFTVAQLGMNPSRLFESAGDDEDDEFDDEDEAPTTSSEVKGYGFLQAPNGGRVRFMPKYENSFGNTSVKINDVSSFCWMSKEADMMKMAAVRFLFEYILANGLEDKVWFSGMIHDEHLLNTTEEEALPAAKMLGQIMREEWAKLVPEVEGIEGEPEDWIADGWNDIH
jgi:ribonuclease D